MLLDRVRFPLLCLLLAAGNFTLYTFRTHHECIHELGGEIHTIRRRAWIIKSTPGEFHKSHRLFSSLFLFLEASDAKFWSGIVFGRVLIFLKGSGDARDALKIERWNSKLVGEKAKFVLFSRWFEVSLVFS
jgi:hypothetical protein